MDGEDLMDRLRALAPWHFNIEVAPGVWTRDANQVSTRMAVINPVELRPLLKRMYPSGLEGKGFLDCACNGGGYSFIASDLGARCFGFDVRAHWIDQARFLADRLGKIEDAVRFEVCDLLNVGDLLGTRRFEVCLFKGIFYHLPDPVAGLKLVADRTDELLILDTALASGCEDGFLQLAHEGVKNRMSGVHGLAWFPTGPEVLRRILEWLGFPATSVEYWNNNQPPELGRARVIGLRDPSMLSGAATSV
jgi:tRNA (mo5U34)-methyltransferase